MQLDKWFTTSFIVNRLTEVVDSGGAIQPAVTQSSTFSGHIYPLNGDERTEREKTEGVTFYKILCPLSTNVLPKDKILQGAINHEVVSSFDHDIGRNPHKEIVTKVEI